MAPTKNSVEEKSDSRLRAVSITEGTMDLSSTSKVEDVEFVCHGIRGRYSGEINDEGKPNGNGSFVRDSGKMTFVGEWINGERTTGSYFNVEGRLVGDVVFE